MIDMGNAFINNLSEAQLKVFRALSVNEIVSKKDLAIILYGESYVLMLDRVHNHIATLRRLGLNIIFVKYRGFKLVV